MNFEKVKNEVMAVGAVTLYFFICFALFMIIKKLLLIEHNINVYGWATALVGALAMGKLVFIVDKLAISRWLDHLKPIYEILLKAIIYTIFFFCLSVVEKCVHYWMENPATETLVQYLFHNGKWAVVLAHDLYIFFCFVVFFTYHFLNQALGKGKMKSLLTTKLASDT